MLQAARYITHQEVIGTPVAEADLVSSMARLSVEDCVPAVGKLMGMLERGQGREAVERELERQLTRPQRRRLQAHPASWVFQHRLAAAMKLALLYSSRTPARGLGTDLRTLVEVILAAADVFDDSGVPTAPPEDLVISMQLQQVVAADLPYVGAAIARAHRLFVELPAAMTATNPKVARLGLPSSFASRSGITLERYVAICAALTAEASTWGQRTGKWGFTDRLLQRTAITPSELAVVMDDLAETPDQLRERLRDERARGLNTLWRLDTFARKPICELTPGVFHPLQPLMFAERVLGDRLWWKLVDLYGKDEFCDALGQLLEEHIITLARSVYRPPRTERLFGEVRLEKRKLGPDLALFEDDDVLLMEISSERIHYTNTVLAGDIASFERDLEHMVIARARQLDTKIKAVREGALNYGVPGVDGTTIAVWPVLMFYSGFPHGHVISERIRRRVAEAGYLRGPNIGPLTIMSPEDFEVAMWLVERGPLTLLDLIQARLADPEGRNECLREFIFRQTNHLELPTFLKETLERASAGWAAELAFNP